MTNDISQIAQDLALEIANEPFLDVTLLAKKIEMTYIVLSNSKKEDLGHKQIPNKSDDKKEKHIIIKKPFLKSHISLLLEEKELQLNFWKSIVKQKLSNQEIDALYSIIDNKVTELRLNKSIGKKNIKL